MPKVLNVAPKDIYVVMEIGLEELKKLRTVMDITKIDYNGKDEEETKAVKYFKEVFYPFVDEVLEEIKHGS